MTRARAAWLAFRAFGELVRFDLARTLTGHTGLVPPRTTPIASAIAIDRADVEREILGAMALACAVYWKPVLCLQRAACTVRLLRAHRLPAKLIVGYRPQPFVSHAWVEVDGRAVSGAAGYAQRLRILHVA